jgi:hypothetical protein
VIDQRLKISRADGRDIELVLQIVLINEIVGNPVSQHEIPRGFASATDVIQKHWERIPECQGLARIASIDIIIV